MNPNAGDQQYQSKDRQDPTQPEREALEEITRERDCQYGFSYVSDIFSHKLQSPVVEYRHVLSIPRVFYSFKRILTVFLAIGLFSFAQPAYAAAITSAGSGNWEAGATWVGGAVLGAGENIHGIKPGLPDLMKVRAR